MVTNLHNPWCGCSWSRPVISDQVIVRAQALYWKWAAASNSWEETEDNCQWQDSSFPAPQWPTLPGPALPHILASDRRHPSGGSQWQPDARFQMGSIALCTSFIEVHNDNRPKILNKYIESGLHFVLKTCRSYIFCVIIVRSMIDKSMALTMRGSFIEISCVRFGVVPPSPDRPHSYCVSHGY